MKSFHPPEGHDFVDTADIQRLSDSNAELFYANLSGRMALFRAEVFSLLSKDNLLGRGATLALYYAGISLEEPPEVEIVLTAPPAEVAPSEVLIALFQQPEAKLPVIRIITNEQVISPIRDDTFIVEDITIDGDDDAQYLMGSLYLDELENGQNPPYSVIRVREGVIFCNIRPCTRVIDIHPDVNDRLLPFGKYTDPMDSLYALDRAREIIASIAGPVAVANAEW